MSQTKVVLSLSLQEAKIVQNAIAMALPRVQNKKIAWRLERICDRVEVELRRVQP